MGKVTPGKKSPGTSRGRGRPRKAPSELAKKKRRAPRLQWPKEQMARAMAAVRNKEMSYGEAEKHFGVPKTTIFDRLNNTSAILGRKPLLSVEEEAIIVSRSELGKVTLKTFLPIPFPTCYTPTSTTLIL